MDPKAESTPVPVTPPSSSGSLPSIKVLLQESWDVLVKSTLNLFILTVISCVLYAMAAALGFFGVVGVGFGTVLSSISNQKPVTPDMIASLFSGPSLGMLFVVFMVTMILFAIIGGIFQIASILVVDNPAGSIGAYLKRSLSLLLPFWLVGFISMLFILGGFYIFVIPAFLFMFFFYFAQFEVVLNNTGGLTALKRSMAMTTHHFGAILMRVILIAGIYILIAIFLPNLIMNIEPATGVIVNMLSFIINILLGWYILAYGLTLYKQSRVGFENSQGSNLIGVWIVSALGWLVLVGLIVFTYQAISSGLFQKMFAEISKQAQEESKNVSQGDQDSAATPYITSGNTKITTASQLANKVSLTEDDRQQIVALINGALEDYEKAAAADPKNPDAHYNTGYAYSLLTTVPDSDKHAILNYEKAVQVDPEYTAAYIGIGGVYYQQKNYTKAIESFQKATQVSPENANAWYNLGMAYKMIGAKNEAKKAFEETLDLMEDDDPTRYLVEKELQ